MLPSTNTRLLHEIWWRHCEKAGYPSFRGQKFPRWRVDLVEEYDIAWKSYSDTKKREILESINDSPPS